MIIGIIVAALACVVLYALWEPYWHSATDEVVAIEGLPPAFEGFSILHLSDIHGRVRVFHWRKFREWLAAVDMVAITGDLYSPSIPRDRLKRELDRLTAPCGVYYISGNHDYRHGQFFVEPWRPGERLLDNRVIELERDGQKILLAGLPDFVKGDPKWDTLRDALHRREEPAILMAHRPDAWLLTGIERIALILSGHTHGGQVTVFGLFAPLRHNHVPHHFVAGRLEVPGKPVLITSRGLGTSELPIRFGARPEIIRIRLTVKKGDRHE